MKFEKTYDIKEWAKWDAIVFDSVKNFSETFSCKPNILQANEHTFSQIDHLTNIRAGYKRNVIDTRTGNKADEKDEVKLDGFECELASIDFACDNQLVDNEFRLIYDNEPEWDVLDFKTKLATFRICFGKVEFVDMEKSILEQDDYLYHTLICGNVVKDWSANKLLSQEEFETAKQTGIGRLQFPLFVIYTKNISDITKDEWEILEVWAKYDILEKLEFSEIEKGIIFSNRDYFNNNFDVREFKNEIKKNFISLEPQKLNLKICDVYGVEFYFHDKTMYLHKKAYLRYKRILNGKITEELTEEDIENIIKS
jgi:hypothetical protein